jgi:Mn2+/Fe2+ NRAMP family transporter
VDRTGHVSDDVRSRIPVFQAWAGHRQGLFHVIRENYPTWILWPALIGVLIGNTIEAAADLGGMAAALNLFIPLPVPLIVIGVAAAIVARSSIRR